MARKGNLSQYKEYLRKRYPARTHHRNKYLTDEYVVVSASDYNHVIRMVNQTSSTIKVLEQALYNISTSLYELSKYVEQL